jgi:glyoxylase-like metal-dependent hydrolase (beta-lactamase superfamily II)
MKDQIRSEEEGVVYPFDMTPEGAEVHEIAPDVLWFRLPLPIALDHVNVFAFADAEGWTVIDTGFATAKAREMWRGFLAGRLGGKPLRRVIVTHFHPDHIGLAGWLQSEYGAKLVTTRTSWLMARLLQLDVQERPVAETIAFWRQAGMDPAILDARLAERPFNFADVVDPLPRGIRTIGEGDAIRFGGRTWDVRLGGGHAPDHATFWSREDELVIGGDQFLPRISPNIGVYASEPDADPMTDWLNSCARFEKIATSQQLILPGHGRPFRGLPSRLRQLIDNHEAAFDRLVEFLDVPRTACDCFVVLFRRPIGSAEYGLAMAEALANLNYLYRKERITFDLRDDGAKMWRSL